MGQQTFYSQNQHTLFSLIITSTFRRVHKTEDIQFIERSKGDEEQVPEHQDESC